MEDHSAHAAASRDCLRNSNLKRDRSLFKNPAPTLRTLTRYMPVVGIQFSEEVSLHAIRAADSNGKSKGGFQNATVPLEGLVENPTVDRRTKRLDQKKAPGSLHSTTMLQTSKGRLDKSVRGFNAVTPPAEDLGKSRHVTLEIKRK